VRVLEHELLVLVQQAQVPQLAQAQQQALL
jgi:hypothetical protein